MRYPVGKKASMWVTCNEDESVETEEEEEEEEAGTAVTEGGEDEEEEEEENIGTIWKKIIDDGRISRATIFSRNDDRTISTEKCEKR